MRWLSPPERVGEAVEREIAQAYVEQKLQAALDLGEQSFCDRRIRLAQLQLVEERFRLANRHSNHLGDVLSAHPHIERFGLQAAASAGGAGGLSAIAGLHHAVLNLIKVLLYELEEIVDAVQARRPMPQQVLLGLRQLVVGAMNREMEGLTGRDEVAQPFAHHLAFPANDSPLIHREAGVGDHQVFVDSQYLAEPFADRAGPNGIVEAEHHVGRLGKGDPVGLELLRELLGLGLSIDEEAQGAAAVSFEEGRLDGVGQSA